MNRKWCFESRYLIFWWGGSPKLTYEVCGYFDNRPRVHVGFLGLFTAIFVLPFRNGWTDECDAPSYGISYHDQAVWFHLGGKGNGNGGSKWKAYYVPWSYDWIRTSVLLKDGLTWEHEVRKQKRKDFWSDKWKDLVWSETYPCRYTLKSGEVQERTARVTVEEREWRMRWSRWLPLFRRVRRTISVEFSDEVGERTGSWKGGVTGCGYELREGETPRECLERMMKERKFN